MSARTFFRVVLLLVLVVALAGGGAFLWLSRTGKPQRSGKVALFELAEPVTVRFDEWAVPHVEARTARDLAMAIGWLHASERMTQMELGRRSAFGRLSAILGERALDLDRAALTLRLGETAEALVDALSVENRGLLDAYALGVNSWIDNHRGGLPPELALLRVDPEPWRPADSLAFLLLLARDLSYPLHFEELRWQWLVRAGPDKLQDLCGNDLAIDEQTLECARRIAAAETPGGADGTAAPARGSPELPEETPRKGSNNWALGAARTKSEAPIVANDPHLQLGIPSLWYQALLRSPEYEASGMTVPGLPLVIVGQNADVAWSFTNTELDASDLFVEELGEDGASVRRGDAFVPLRRRPVLIAVRNDDPVSMDLWDSDIGPFLPADPARGLPPRSLAWTAYERFDPLATFTALARARSVDELPAKCASFVGPAQNVVAADRGGGLAFFVLGRVPERARGDGRLPLPAWDLASRWTGLRPAAENPRVLAPSDDLLATANNDVRPAGYALPFPAQFDMEFRAERVRERLLARDAWWPADVAAVQADVTSLFARRVGDLLPAQVEGEAALARSELAAWDGAMETSGVAALFALFERELVLAVYGDELAVAGTKSLPGFSRGEAVLAALDGSLDEAWFDDVRTSGAVETLLDCAQLALTRAWREGNKRFGPSVATWDYGALHAWTARHPLDRLPFGERLLDRGPFPVPGSPTSIAAFGGRWRGESIDVTHGPSMRWIGDTGDPDRSLCVLPTGQSGHPADPHYDDQLPLFLAGKAHKMQWSAQAIEAATVSTLLLTP